MPSVVIPTLPAAGRSSAAPICHPDPRDALLRGLRRRDLLFAIFRVSIFEFRFSTFYFPIANLLRKRCTIEVIHENLHERGAVQVRQLGNLADHPDVPKTLDGLAVLAVLVADQHHAVHR